VKAGVENVKPPLPPLILPVAPLVNAPIIAPWAFDTPAPPAPPAKPVSPFPPLILPLLEGEAGNRGRRRSDVNQRQRLGSPTRRRRHCERAGMMGAKSQAD